MQIMDYCYKRTEQLKQEHAYIRDIFDQFVQPRSENIYMEPLITRPTISLSNVGQWGYEAPISPLFPNEVVKLTLAKIERKQVWNNKTKQFEIRDMLPVGISVDHRVFDGNIPVPHMMQAAFDQVFDRMLQDAKTPPVRVKSSIQLDEFIQASSAQEYGWQGQPKADSAHPQYPQVQALCQGSLHHQGGKEKLPEPGDGCAAKKLV